MIICGLDFESNGLDVEKAHITEVGAVLFDAHLGSAVEELSCFLYDESYPPQTNSIIELTGITDEDLKQEGISPSEAFEKLLPMMAKADYIMAHNKKFDQRIGEHFAAKYGHVLTPKPWICSLTEVEWPKQISCRKLSHIALELHPDLLFKDGKKIKLHRAMNDVELMLNLVHRTFDWEVLVKYAVEPWVTLQVLIPTPWTDNGVGKEWAKKNGYGWERPHGSDLEYPKAWVKRVKESKVEAEKNDKPYEIKCV